MKKYFQRMTLRERLLFGSLLAVALVLANAWLLDHLSRRNTRLRAELAAQRAELTGFRRLLEEAPLWAERNAWLDKHQPRLENPERAAVDLLDDIKEIARLHGEILLENQELGGLEKRPAAQSVAVAVTAKGSWAGFVQFLHALQSPRRFIAVEQAEIEADPANPARLSARLKIVKWYAP